jgi:hypothetical protein
VAIVPQAFGLGCDGVGPLALGVAWRSYCADGEGVRVGVGCGGGWGEGGRLVVEPSVALPSAEW